MMNTKTKISLIIATALVLIGFIMFTVTMAILGFDFKKLSTTEYETTEHTEISEFSNISIKSNTANIEIIPSDNNETSVVCYEEINLRHSVSVEDGTLVIRINKTKKWYEYIGINFDTAKVTVYMPKGQYGNLTVDSSTSKVTVASDFAFKNVDISINTGDVKFNAYSSENVKIKTSTGHITLGYLSAGQIDLKASTGKISASHVACNGKMSITVTTGDTSLTDVVCGSLTSSGSTGDLNLNYVVASDKFSLERDTGDITLKSCDAPEIIVVTDTGDVRGTLRSSKVFITKTDTGKVKVPDSITGGRCEITTDTGDIVISFE